jgi:hypothetical protein
VASGLVAYGVMSRLAATNARHVHGDIAYKLVSRKACNDFLNFTSHLFFIPFFKRLIFIKAGEFCVNLEDFNGTVFGRFQVQ